MSDSTATAAERHTSAIRETIDGLTFGNYIDGATVNAASGETFAPEDPTVAEPIADVAKGSLTDVDDAVAAAETAANGEWGTLTPMERGDLLREWAATLREHLDELAMLGALEVGKPLESSREDVEAGVRFIEYYASVAAGAEGSVPDVGEDALAYVQSEPYGATGQILPWNYPILLLGWKVGAALATGNTSVTKPAEQTPLGTIRAAQLSQGIFPDGVLNIVNGFGETGAALSGHDRIRKVSFTGSVPVGRKVMRAAADDITPVTLELGGKNPLLVFPDADIEDAAETAADAGLYNNGQSCDSGTRILIHEDIEEEFMAQYLDAVESYVPGDPLENADQGPLCHREHWESVQEYIELGKEEATLLTGGGVPEGTPKDGYFVEPTVFVDVEPEMRIAQEEVFGPVQFLMTFGDETEAVEIANGTDYGLASGVFTQDVSRAHRIADALEAGSVWVNHYFGTVPGTPFGGFKQSGIGRECADSALDEYTQQKTVRIALE